MKAPDARTLLTGWPTRRFEILRTPIRDLRVGLAGSFYERVIARVARDLRRRELPWMPDIYLSNGWHCPDRVPVIGVPFTLATRELRRLDLEVTGELEGLAEMAALLRHEVGHAYNYAFRLHETSEWRGHFGPFSRPYRERYVRRRGSRRHVVHLRNSYAQKHPDEDFAETFAVWLTPRSRWRERYAGWPARAKLEYVDRVMREVRGRVPRVAHGPLADPLRELDATVAEHYRSLRYRIEARGFRTDLVSWFDDELRRIFRDRRSGRALPADQALRRLRRPIVRRVAGLLGVRPAPARQLYDKYVGRVAALGLASRTEDRDGLLVDVTTMLTRHLLHWQRTRRFTEWPGGAGSAT